MISIDHQGGLMMTKTEAAIDLARKHYEIDPGMEQIFWLAGPAEVELDPKEPIKFLEVNRHTVASGIMPIRFGPSRSSGMAYPVTIVEITPEEFDMVLSRELKLPHGWVIGDPIPRPSPVLQG